MKIYVASSWRNQRQPHIVTALRSLGHDVYDFKNPENGPFRWSDIDEEWQSWSFETYLEQLKSEVAEKGFKQDFDAMLWADLCVLVLPCGTSAHLEAGWFVGQGKPVVFLIEDPIEPELMYKMATKIVTDFASLKAALEDLEEVVQSLRELRQ